MLIRIDNMIWRMNGQNLFLVGIVHVGNYFTEVRGVMNELLTVNVGEKIEWVY
jgi:hypothetical protein